MKLKHAQRTTKLNGYVLKNVRLATQTGSGSIWHAKASKMGGAFKVEFKALFGQMQV